mmetsp:Transcript_22436/g.53746  ORF Transcript_22436/g.53746 Transcript_22436/m.53746 type:complete len:228 (-) Transcript_22436:349-1032(-)
MATRLLSRAMSSALLPSAQTAVGSAPASSSALAACSLFARAARQSGVSPFCPPALTSRWGAARTSSRIISPSPRSAAWCSTVLAMPMALHPTTVGSAPHEHSSPAMACSPAPTAWWSGVRPCWSRALMSAPRSISILTSSTASARAASVRGSGSSTSSSFGSRRSSAKWRSVMCSMSSISSSPVSASILPQLPLYSSHVRCVFMSITSRSTSSSTMPSRTLISLLLP